jgi:hypothetical protein
MKSELRLGASSEHHLRIWIDASGVTTAQQRILTLRFSFARSKVHKLEETRVEEERLPAVGVADARRYYNFLVLMLNRPLVRL